MSADLSRVRFDPLRDFSQVLLQQGRVLLDGDYNEFVALVDRRIRAETVDLTSFGPDPDKAGESWVPRQTADGFKVTATAGALDIGRGRMYVDGILAENHGVLPLDYDALLEESTGSADTPYLDQPYWPTPDAVPTGGTHLAYLDVWQREVTHVEAPDLVEVAVGVDTTTRIQTAWQVRLLQNVGAITTTTDDVDIPGWSELIRPSSGRLTVDTVAVDAEDDPCALPPTGGYRGLENQTYRVEIHTGGAPGTATFKWSKENASVVQPVVEMLDPTTLRLSSVGRDDVLRISTNDWVEIIDDHYELGLTPGIIRKVVVDDASRTITFTGALPADLQPVDADDAAARHLRVRRWDQAGLVRSGAGATIDDLDKPTSTGLITVPVGAATQIVLDAGIVVSFSLAETDGTFHDGDFWIFAARTTDTSVELLTAAPPLGVHHHYARLAIIDLPDTETDCRRLWPPVSTGDGASCDCTVCVDPESHASGALTLQAAIDSVKEVGGTVCLHAGVYDVGPGVDIDNARSVRIHGQGMATVLVSRAEAIRINRSVGIGLDHLSVISGVAAAEAILVNSAVRSSFEDLVVLALGNADQRGAAVRLTGLALDLSFRHNLLLGAAGITAGRPHPDDQPVPGIFGGVLRLTDNLVAGRSGIDLGEFSAFVESVIVDSNDILAADGVGVRANGALGPAAAVTVERNTIWTDGTGIVVGGVANVAGNTVVGLDPKVVQGDPPVGSEGIVVETRFPGWARQVEIDGNRIERRGGAAIALRSEVVRWVVQNNDIATAGAGITIEGKGRADFSVAVDRNRIADIQPVDPAMGDFTAVVGISVLNTDQASVTNNSVSQIGFRSGVGPMRAGISVHGVRIAHVSANMVDGVGTANGVGLGIVVTGHFGQTTVTENWVSNGFVANPENTAWIAVAVQPPFGLSIAGQGGIAPPAIVPLGFQKGAVSFGEQMVIFSGKWAFLTGGFPNDHVTYSTNSTRSSGNSPGVILRTRGDVIAVGNQLFDESIFERPNAVGFEIASRTATLTSNRVRGRGTSILLKDPSQGGMGDGDFMALGNITAGGIDYASPGQGVGTELEALNRIVPGE